MLGHPPQCSRGVSTQVLAECTPALAGEGRKNQSLLVPNVLERAEERRSTLRELAKVARAEGRPRPPAVRTASRKGSNDQLQIGLGCAERRRVGRDRRAARARREHRSAAGAVPLTWLCRAGQCLNDHIAGAVSTAIAATARWRASAASAGERLPVPSWKAASLLGTMERAVGPSSAVPTTVAGAVAPERGPSGAVAPAEPWPAGWGSDCQSAVLVAKALLGTKQPAQASKLRKRRQRTGAPRRVDASRPGAEQARTSGATRACRGGRLFQPPDIGVQAFSKNSSF